MLANYVCRTALCIKTHREDVTPDSCHYNMTPSRLEDEQDGQQIRKVAVGTLSKEWRLPEMEASAAGSCKAAENFLQ
jgi:hypothetical protein